MEAILEWDIEIKSFILWLANVPRGIKIKYVG